MDPEYTLLPFLQYIVVGGEDDLVTVYSMSEKRVVLRGQGHKSWVSVVAFDPYNLSYGDLPDGLDFSGSDEEGPVSGDDVVQHQNSNSSSTITNATTNSVSFNQSGSVRRQSHHRRTGAGSAEVNGDRSSQQHSQTSISGDTLSSMLPISSNSSNVTCYRFGSVGQDTLICLWDITEEALTRASRGGTCAMSPLNSGGFGGKFHLNASSHTTSFSCNATTSNSSTLQHGHNSSTCAISSNHVKMSNSNSMTSKDSGIATDTTGGGGGSSTSSAATSGSAVSSSGGGMSLTSRLASFTLGGGDKNKGEKEERSSGRGLRGNFSLGRSSKDKDSDKHGGSASSLPSSAKTVNSSCQNNSSAAPNSAGQQSLSEENGEGVRLGSILCPRIHDVPVIEPLVVKKIAHERLTALVFREECLVTACQDGYVCTWARPGRVVSKLTFCYRKEPSN